MAWAAEHRDTPTLGVELATVSLVRSRYREEDGERLMAQEPWRTVPLTGPRTRAES